MKQLNSIRTIILLLLLTSGLMCRRVYQPAVIKTANNFLVVDGVINTDPLGTTNFSLSRTRNLSDSLAKLPELNADVKIEADNGGIFSIIERGNGLYSASQLPVQANRKYRVLITTSDQTRYESDFVPAQFTPLIDSVEWSQNNDVRVFVSTHDPTNNSRYYRWEYDETYEYHSRYSSIWIIKNGQAVLRDSSELVHVCWASGPGNNIVTGSSAQLSQDIIPHQVIAVIPKGSEKINFRYSILVKQYALTLPAYNYWQILKKNSQELGTLFDAQPSQLVGNLHCVSRPGEPVIGFVSASTVQAKRIFIDSTQLTDWNVQDTSSVFCQTKLQSPPYNFADTSYTVYYFVDMPSGAVTAPKRCIDCTWRGGSNVKPSFW